MADQIPGPVGDSLAETGKKDEWIKTGKKLGEKEKQAKKAKVSLQNQKEENKIINFGKVDKSDPARKAKLEKDRAARIKANEPRQRVTRRQGKRVKAAFPETQTVDEFLDLQKLTKSIRVRTSY
jgi:hypothetical protein